ncbi:MAG: right-handed parallel beta-helix repeat-containing protein [Salinivirgaceae bacterium]|nr:right-handed parallel beta-helix repeat-containing protein [Salinivirgaceae bacterium]
MTHKIQTYLFLATLLALVISCRDMNEISTSSDARLNFSTDTIQFDTVFINIGSTTQQFKIYNNNKDAVKTTISLGDINSLHYRLNIDGQPTNKVNDYEIRGNDSLYVFVEVTINPADPNSPLVVEDSIMFYTNGNTQNIKLVAYGQDVHLYKDSVVDTRTWIADKPYLIYNSILVDSAETLTIEEGAKIYFHNNSALYVQGTIDVEGSSENPVVFQGDRLDEYYKDLPGQWWGSIENENGTNYTGCIHFWPGSKNNIINHAIIKNGVIGIFVYNYEENNYISLTLRNSVIHNMSSMGIWSQFSNIIVENSVISNCKYYNVVHAYGGHAEFYQTTIGNYYPHETRNDPSLILTNFFESENGKVINNYSAKFVNSIVYGSLDNEVAINYASDPTKEFYLEFDHCMLKLDKDFDTSNEDIFKDIIRDEFSKPNFMDVYNGDFRLDTLSAAKDAGTTQYIDLFPIDMDGNNRLLDGLPDLGAYERIE